MPLLGTRGIASAKDFGLTSPPRSGPPPAFTTSIATASTGPYLILVNSFGAPSGNTYVWGYRQSTSTPYLTKIDYGGNESWTRSINSSTLIGSVFTTRLNEDVSGNVYCSVTSGGTTYFLKFDSSGTLQFQYSYTGYGTDATAAFIDSSGNLYIGGSTSNIPRMVKIDSSGTFQWGVLANAVIPDMATGMSSAGIFQVDATGNVYWGLSGYNSSYTTTNAIIKITSSGTVTAGKRIYPTSGTFSLYSQRSLLINKTGSVYVSGTQNGLQTVVALDSSFAVSWAKSGVGNGPLTPDKNNGLFVYGTGLTSAGNLANSYSLSITDTSPYPLPGSTFESDGIGGLVATPNSNSVFPTWNATRISSDLSDAGSYYVYSPSASAGSAMNVLVTKSANPTLTTPSFTTTGNLGSTFTTTTATRTTTTFTAASVTLGVTVQSMVGFTGGSATYGGLSGGTFTWICPPGVTSVSVVAVGSGGGGYYAQGGGGGGLGWKNNIAVTPGSSYTVVTGAYVSGGTYSANNGNDSYFINTSTVRGGGGRGGGGNQGSGGTYTGDGGGNGGPGSSFGGGGGAGGYTGAGGSADAAGSGGGAGGGFSRGYNNTSYGGGGVGVMGQGPNGLGGTGSNNNGGSGGAATRFNLWGGNFGSGGWAGGYTPVYCSYYGGTGCAPNSGGQGSGGGVRIVWPGNTRTFPSTNVGTP